MRDEGYNGESLSSPAEQAEAPDPVRFAVDAVSIGTWSWDIGSGNVEATPWTYRLFGLDPGTVEGSYDLFMRQVHAADRPAVEDWLSRAMRVRTRTALVFRVDQPDGTVRWLRSTGRVLLDERGVPVRMAGVVEEVSGELQRPSFTPSSSPSSPLGASFSARQVAHMLGIADATLKRIALAGNLKWLRSTRKNSRRFAPEDVIAYLRKGSTSEIDFDAAAAAGDMSSCLVDLLEQLIKGTAIDVLLDEQVRPAARVSQAPFIADLLSRLPFMVVERQGTNFPVLFAQVGQANHPDAELIGCMLQAQGHEILRPAGALAPAQLADLAERVRARMLVLVIGNGPVAIQIGGLSTAGAIATAHSGATTVCVWSDERLPVPRGVVRFRSMRELGSALRSA